MLVNPLFQTESSASNKASLQQAVTHHATLGEGLGWHGATESWWWTDIEAATLQAWSPGKPVVTYKLPDRLGSFAHCQSGRILLGLAKRLCFTSLPKNSVTGMAAASVSPASASTTSTSSATAAVQLPVQSLVAVDPAETRTRVNDGRTDRRGYFVFGTMNEAAEKRPIASFYQFSMQYGLRRLALPAVAIANSICFSLDGKTMYFTDTLTRRIQQCDYDAESAKVDNIRLFAIPDDDKAYPDGSVIDQQGCLWNAEWGAGSVTQYAPDGRRLQRLSVATKNPTCPAFGGINGDQLMVSSARQEMSAEELLRMPGAGSLFLLQMDESLAVPDTLFDDNHTGAVLQPVPKTIKRQ
ncbi:SMP-30/gluconolactonase/LRE family protein [Undibacterium sp. Di26W]|uniref:SMP-30/gluconolactonase/LRE family protein n=1 Tax=Undibacterium sp. Di26W TaxID=3413035 RepID=UPI003BF006E3